MQIDNIFAFDVSKLTLDYCVLAGGREVATGSVANESVAFGELVQKLMGELGLAWGGTLFCLEWTGAYSRPLMAWLGKKRAMVWAEGGVQIKKSLGVTRGKSDRVDAHRIAMYAWRNRDAARLWEPPSLALSHLKSLLSARALLKRQAAAQKVALREQQTFLGEGFPKAAAEALRKAAECIDKQILAIEKRMKEIIAGDAELKRLYDIVTSVEGVGFVVAVHFLVTTNAFTTVKDGRKYSCYAGCAPFVYLSGTSVRGGSHVSHHANKDVKSVLTMGAIGSLSIKDGELRAYYHRKIGEGKPHGKVVNAMRNKIILRVFACVRDGRPYEKRPVPSLSTQACA